MSKIKTILCIEDDRFIGEMYKHSLEKNGYAVTWITNGSEGLNLALTQYFDLIIIDIILPETQGDNIIRQIDTHYADKEKRPKTAILTNYDQQEEDRLELEHISDAYYIKAEITPRKLLSIIDELSEE